MNIIRNGLTPSAKAPAACITGMDSIDSPFQADG
jgi:hypothetical protein